MAKLFMHESIVNILKQKFIKVNDKLFYHNKIKTDFIMSRISLGTVYLDSYNHL